MHSRNLTAPNWRREISTDLIVRYDSTNQSRATHSIAFNGAFSQYHIDCLCYSAYAYIVPEKRVARLDERVGYGTFCSERKRSARRRRRCQTRIIRFCPGRFSRTSACSTFSWQQKDRDMTAKNMAQSHDIRIEI